MPLFLVQSIRKKSVTMQHSPSAVFHYSDTGGHSSHMHHCKVNAIFQAAKKDLLKIFQLKVRPHFIILIYLSKKFDIVIMFALDFYVI